MSLSSRLRSAVDALLGVSTYQPPGRGYGPQITDKEVEEIREAIGGNLQPLPTTKLRWYLEDLEAAQTAADNGFMRPAAQLSRAMRRDGFLQGLRKSRTKGLTRLPKRFYGDSAVADILKARNGSRSVFDEMHPPSELEQMDGDFIDLGVAVGELLPVPGRSFPVLCRLEPEFLQYRWQENRWYFNSVAGPLPITPGDGRWVLHVGNRLTPWTTGLWPALGRSFVNKEHAIMYRANFCAKLANPARLAYAPLGATEAQRIGFFQKIMAWGTNTVIELPVGYDAKLLELSGGKTFEVFQKQIDTSDLEYMIAIAGQLLTTKGGSGFDGQDVAEAIRQDLIQADGDALAYTLNTQTLPAFVVSHFGEEALNHPTIVEWDTGSSVDKERETRTLGQSADAIARLTVALAPYEKRVDVEEMTVRFGIPTLDGAAVSVLPPDASAGESGAGDLKVAPALPAASSNEPRGLGKAGGVSAR